MTLSVSKCYLLKLSVMLATHLFVIVHLLAHEILCQALTLLLANYWRCSDCSDASDCSVRISWSILTSTQHFMSQLQQQYVQTVYSITASDANNKKMKKKHRTINTKVTKQKILVNKLLNNRELLLNAESFILLRGRLVNNMLTLQRTHTTAYQLGSSNSRQTGLTGTTSSRNTWET